MEYNVRIIEPEALMSQLPDLLLEAESIPLVISGNSMAPFLKHGRDTVYFSRITQPPRRGDIILYRRHCGAYILHRIYRQCGNSYDLLGDGQLGIEPGIVPAQMLAIVNVVRRKGKLLRKGNLCWAFFAHVWPALLPLRRILFRIRSAIMARRKET